MASSHESFQRLAKLFDEAVRIVPGPDRAAYLDRECGADDNLKSELEKLLSADAAIHTGDSSSIVRLPHFGVYQAREKIGAGGMGTVFLATREDDDVRQQVAIKVIPAVFWSEVFAERFRRERQILAELNHPNIASFLDSGVSADGMPYLVMEYVDGERIDSWCDRRALPVRGRLELFLKVTAAVSFAHQKLIVHRDLKPANILVTGSGEPKLLDFGVARTLLAEAGAATLTSNLFVTPLYASPELLRGQPPTVAADIYSLGVILFELLSGARPFGGGEENSPAIIVERVVSVEPLRLEDAASESAAQAQGETLPSLKRKLRGDLSAIVSKALSKDLAARYASVEQFADDVRRHLAGVPILASPAGPLRRAWKFTLRHKVGVASGCVIAFSLAAGVAGTWWESRIAERRFAQTRSLARYVMFDLTQSIGALAGSTPVQADMVKHSLEYLDRLSAERMSDPTLRTEVGEGYLRLASLLGHPSQNNLGDLAKAKETYRKAIAILEPASEDKSNLQANLALAKAKNELGQTVGFGSETGEGVQLIEGATRDISSLAQRWPNDFGVRLQASSVFESLALALSFPQGYITPRALDRSLPALRTAKEHAEAAVRLRPGDASAVRQLAMTLKMMGNLVELQDAAAAAQIYRQAYSVLDGLSADNRKLPASRNARSSVLIALGDNLRGSGDIASARTALEEARTIRDELWKEDPKNTLYLRQRVDPYDYLIRVSGKEDQLHYYKVLNEIYDQLAAQYPSSEGIRFKRASLQAATANVAFDLGRKEEAIRLAGAGLPVMKQIGLASQAPVTQAIAAGALLDVTIPGFADPAAALELAQRAVKGFDGKEPESLTILAHAYWSTGDRQDAIDAQQRALALMVKAPAGARAEGEKTLARYRNDKVSGRGR
ncbi:MAG TPA: serine/threonine-protein kinase [Bryobacteraceae bacterium]|nr:serine/threonine-protein kinase [Bryobacteraceae bacterium]